MDQLGKAVDAQMRLHAEIPLVALLGLVGHRLAAEVDADEAPHGKRVV
jgi:hypothetical protein